jgi:hypothetical protein
VTAESRSLTGGDEISIPISWGKLWEEGTMSNELEIVVPGEYGDVLVCRHCGQTLTANSENRGCKRCNWYEEWAEAEPSEWVQIVYRDPRPVGIDQSARDARAAEFIRHLLGVTLDVYDVEIHPPTATSKPAITFNDDDDYQALEERAARSGMTVEELLEAVLWSTLAELEGTTNGCSSPGDSCAY